MGPAPVLDVPGNLRVLEPGVAHGGRAEARDDRRDGYVDHAAVDDEGHEETVRLGVDRVFAGRQAVGNPLREGDPR